MNMIFKYFFVSILAAVIDMGLSLFLFNSLNIDFQTATNAGIVIGFVFQYIISLRFVFKEKNNYKNIILYLITWGIGVMIANITIVVSYELGELPYYLSKCISMMVPFFFTYFIRKTFIEKRKKKNEALL